MIHRSEQSGRPVERESSSQPLCALKSALGLIAGKQIRVSKLAYPSGSPSRFARFLQVERGARGLLFSFGRERTLVTGKRLAYREGEIEYFTGDLFNRWQSFPSATRPFFVVPGGDPAGSIAAIIGCDHEPAPRLYISRFQCTVVIMANRGACPAVMHYAGCADSVAELGRTASGLEIASADAHLRPYVAHLLEHKALPNGAAILAQTRISADPHEFSWRRIDAATDLWSSFKFANNEGERVRLDARLDFVCDSFAGYRDLLAPAADALRKWCESAQFPARLSHGDFWLGNVLFKGDSVAGIIDWEWARRDGIPLSDTVHMLLRSPSMERDTSFALCLRELWADEIADSELNNRLARLCAQSGIGRDDLKFLGLVLWFDILWERAFRGVVESAVWLNDMVPQSTPVIMKWLKQRG